MIVNLYNVQDILTGFGASPFGMESDEIAERTYTDFLKNVAKHPEDMRLFKIGSMDTETGEIFADTPKCIQGGGQPREEENNGKDEV